MSEMTDLRGRIHIKVEPPKELPAILDFLDGYDLTVAERLYVAKVMMHTILGTVDADLRPALIQAFVAAVLDGPELPH